MKDYFLTQFNSIKSDEQFAFNKTLIILELQDQGLYYYYMHYYIHNLNFKKILDTIINIQAIFC